jgi:hypothetical protein
VPYYRPDDQPQPPRQPRPGRLLWTLHQGADTQSAELQDSETFGVELQLFHNGKLVYAHRHQSVALAIDEADSYRERLEAEGWWEST